MAAESWAAGPARVASISSREGLRKLRGVKVMGLPQPRMSGLRKMKRTGQMSMPRRSKWRAGFMVRRPIMRAVGSPRRLAAQAWAQSCREMESTITTSSKTIKAYINGMVLVYGRGRASLGDWVGIDFVALRWQQ